MNDPFNKYRPKVGDLVSHGDLEYEIIAVAPKVETLKLKLLHTKETVILNVGWFSVAPLVFEDVQW